MKAEITSATINVPAKAKTLLNLKSIILIILKSTRADNFLYVLIVKRVINEQRNYMLEQNARTNQKITKD